MFKEKTGNLFDLKNAKLVETRGGRIPVGGVLRKIANEHGLLIGDAAGAVSPLTAGGLDPAMRLSKFAAELFGKDCKPIIRKFYCNIRANCFEPDSFHGFGCGELSKLLRIKISGTRFHIFARKDSDKNLRSTSFSDAVLSRC